MKKKVSIKIFSVILAVAMIFTSAPLEGLNGIELPDLFNFSLKTEAATYNGTCGDNLKWSLNDETGTLEITGTGAMCDYSYGTPKAPGYSHKISVKTVNIADGITSIGDYAFYYCDNLASVTIPDQKN